MMGPDALKVLEVSWVSCQCSPSLRDLIRDQSVGGHESVSEYGMFWWHGSAFRALECNEAQEQADPSANTWADVNQPTRLIEEPVANKNCPTKSLPPSLSKSCCRKIRYSP